MSIAVLYHSVTGNTKKVADAMAEAVGCTAQPVKEYSLDAKTDLIFIGGAIYGGKLDAVMDSFLQALTPEKAKRVVLFSTCITREKARELMKEQLQRNGITVDDKSFLCKGKFLFLNLRHPSKVELEEARTFAKSVIAK
jgi:flavodoxin